uniref:Uncharacterized protein n=2 Tax=Cajanus cajan TaxID=3821 RepID=A0A151REW6_CAJCA|nr:hypothetical protein KK1_037546 [Cajanus cajan]
MPQVVNPYIINENIKVSQRPRRQQLQSLLPLVIEVPQYVVKNGPEKPSEEFSTVQKALLPSEQPVPAIISHCRSKSKRAPRNDMNMKRSATLMKIEEKVDEENDFNSMTIEELNWRFEEFIKKFNRQVRLEANRDVLQIAD